MDMVSKALSKMLSLAYIKNRFIGEGGRLISDIADIWYLNNIGGCLVTTNIENAFHSLDQKFILAVLKKKICKNFVARVVLLLNNQE